ncbi:protein of unknown function [Burkholderia multivorans]
MQDFQQQSVTSLTTSKPGITAESCAGSDIGASASRVAIPYDILIQTGLRRVIGELLHIKNEQGMTFGVHCNVGHAFDSPERYVVTHIQSGFMVGGASTRMLAIDDAQERIRKAEKAGTLASSVEKAMRVRAEVVATNLVAGGQA